MCKVFKVSRSGFYKYCHKKPNTLKPRLITKIKDAYDKSNKSYGYRRIYQKLKSDGVQCYKNGIYNLMQDNNLKAKGRSKYKVTTNSNHSLMREPNRLSRQFNPEKLNRSWASDITYIWTREGWLYLSVIMDLSSRKIISYQLSTRMNKELVSSCLHTAIRIRKPESGLVFHSDQGSQYASKEVKNILSSIGALGSMSRRGNCWDNAVVESFFKTIKTEMLDYEQLQTRSEAEMKIFHYIEMFYNTKRLHSSIGYQSPVAYEKKITI
jgi:transposase InsO family protein